MLLPLALHVPFLDEWGVILILGLLFFGKRLPEVGRSIGKGIVEFKKGLQGIEDDIETGANASKPQFKYDPQTGQPLHGQLANAVPVGAKFDPYTGKPLSNDTVGSGQT